MPGGALFERVEIDVAAQVSRHGVSLLALAGALLLVRRRKLIAVSWPRGRLQGSLKAKRAVEVVSRIVAEPDNVSQGSGDFVYFRCKL